MFEGTNIKEGDVTKELIGWEYHGFPVKKDSSLIVLGSGKILPNKFADDNPPDHAVTIYTAPKGNFVFNAGTCFWNLPLSTPPGSQTPVNNQGDQGKKIVGYVKDDPRIQRITKNLLDKAFKFLVSSFEFLVASKHTLETCGVAATRNSKLETRNFRIFQRPDFTPINFFIFKK